MGCSASDSLRLENGANASNLQGCPAAATLLQLQEFNLLLPNQLLIIIGLVALAIWVRLNIASISEHYTTCLEELLREERMVTKGLEAHLQDLNDDFRAQLQDAEDRMTRMDRLQDPEHYTTCLEELLREERMVTEGLQDLNDDFRAQLQDAEDRMTRMEEVQRPFDACGSRPMPAAATSRRRARCSQPRRLGHQTRGPVTRSKVTREQSWKLMRSRSPRLGRHRLRA